MNLKIFLLRNMHFLGGFFIGLSIPIGFNKIFSSQIIDFAIFFPIGIILSIISYYYTFVYKQ